MASPESLKAFAVTDLHALQFVRRRAITGVHDDVVGVTAGRDERQMASRVNEWIFVVRHGDGLHAALAVDTDTVEPYVVDIVGAPTWQENGFSGTCTLTYQVQPTPNADYDEFLQWSGATLGDDLSEFANWIAKTANEDLP